jgi:two-component system NtrC family sensor kinase
VRLKTNIFLWVLLASILPLMVLSLAAITYSEKQYLKEVNREVNASLNNIVSEIDRRLYYERQMILSLANSASMKQYLPVLQTVTRGDLHQAYFQLSDRLENFLSSFQGVVPGFKLIRVLDNEGNTLIKVRFGVGFVGSEEGIESTPYAEDELDDPAFVRQLNDLPRSELSFLLQPQSRWEDDEDLRGPVMLDAVYPLATENETVGYLMVSFSGDLADKILDVVPRLHDGKLLLAEINPDDKDRDGMLLYDDIQGLHLSESSNSPMNLRMYEGGMLWENVHNKPYGQFISDSDTTITYFHEYLPYPNQLATWVLAARVDRQTLVAPFDQIRWAILFLVVVAIAISVVLANMGARNIARPISELSSHLKRYADGDHRSRVRVGGAREIQQMEASFNYMADTLEHAREERDRAQGMMLQSAKLASIGEMAAGIGHEINNPLNNIMSLIKLMKRDLSEDQAKMSHDLDSLREETLRASTIVKGILNFARQVPPQYTRFNAMEWMQETWQLVQQSARTKHIECQLIADNEMYIQGDRVQLQQVLVNLLLNAIQASGRDSEIIVSMEERDAYQYIHVEDHGKGIAGKDLTRIFDPFFSTKEVGEGSGLGLSISLGIVQRHDGQLRINNNSDGGVTATIVLPQAHLENVSGHRL